jgi:hypothetical protein
MNRHTQLVIRKARAIDKDGEHVRYMTGVRLDLTLKQARMVASALKLARDTIADLIADPPVPDGWDWNDLPLIDHAIELLQETEADAQAYFAQISAKK